MVILIGLSLAGLAYSIPRRKNKAHIAALGMVTLLFALVLLMIYNFDRPFSSVLALQPSAMESTAEDITADYEEAYQTPLPCDDQGAPLATPVATAADPAPAAQSEPATAIRAGEHRHDGASDGAGQVPEQLHDGAEIVMVSPTSLVASPKS